MSGTDDYRLEWFYAGHSNTEVMRPRGGARTDDYRPACVGVDDYRTSFVQY